MPDDQEISGIYPMLYGLFDAGGAVDRTAMVKQVEAVVLSGAHGLAILGLATEVGKLDTSERRAVLDCVAQAVNGRLPFAVTIAEPSVAGQVAFGRAAADVGAQWLVLQPPPGGGATEGDLLRFFGAVADGVSLPVAIQNAPDYLGVGLSNQGLATLRRQHGNLSLLKAEGPATYLRQLIEDTDGAFRIFNGRAGIELTESLRAGCVGLIPGAETADAQAAIYDLMVAGDEAEAERRFRELLPLLLFLMESIRHLVCYGKRLAAWRMDLGEIHDRAPAGTPSTYGLDLLERLSADLGDMRTG
jgi:4-hydroxy-tetrahydrodipicolinate synthase